MRKGKGTDYEEAVNEIAWLRLFAENRFDKRVIRDALLFGIIESGNPLVIEACVSRSLEFPEDREMGMAIFAVLKELSHIESDASYFVWRSALNYFKAWRVPLAENDTDGFINACNELIAQHPAKEAELVELRDRIAAIGRSVPRTSSRRIVT
jgi:hypothetical protein